MEATRYIYFYRCINICKAGVVCGTHLSGFVTKTKNIAPIWSNNISISHTKSTRRRTRRSSHLSAIIRDTRRVARGLITWTQISNTLTIHYVQGRRRTDDGTTTTRKPHHAYYDDDSEYLLFIPYAYHLYKWRPDDHLAHSTDCAGS